MIDDTEAHRSRAAVDKVADHLGAKAALEDLSALGFGSLGFGHLRG